MIEGLLAFIEYFYLEHSFPIATLAGLFLLSNILIQYALFYVISSFRKDEAHQLEFMAVFLGIT